MLSAVPPHESITPRRKQLFYDFAVETFNYGSELLAYKDSSEFSSLDASEQDKVIAEIELITQLNELQVTQIDTY